MSAAIGSPGSAPAWCRRMSPAFRRRPPGRPPAARLGRDCDRLPMLSPRCSREVARFAAAPLGVLAARSTLSALLETYLGRRSAAQVLAGRLRRETGETIRAVLLYADLRGFTELSEATPPKAVVAALDAWFDRIAGAVHAFGGEVLKFIGDGVLAIFPVGERAAAAACDAALRAVAAARAGMAHLDRAARGARPAAARRSAWRCISARCCGATSAPPTASTSPRSALPSTWSAAWKACAGRLAAACWSPARSRRSDDGDVPLGEHAYAASPRPARCSRCPGKPIPSGSSAGVRNFIRKARPVSAVSSDLAADLTRDRVVDSSCTASSPCRRQSSSPIQICAAGKRHPCFISSIT